MLNPFPGMNPWLENPAIWRDVHQRLITTLANSLGPRLRPRYFVAVETHTYVSVSPDVPVATRFPDVMVIDRGGPAVETALAADSLYLTVELPIREPREPIEEGYMEIRLASTGEIVTVIELVSHTSKQMGHDLKFYDPDVHFVEIDLLRAGPPMPHTERAASSHYRLFIRRRERPHQARLYPFSVRQPIPTFPLPLLPDDAEPVVDLNALLNTVYNQAGYDLVLRYDQPPAPPLSAEDTAWTATVMTKQSG